MIFVKKEGEEMPVSPVSQAIARHVMENCDERRQSSRELARSCKTDNVTYFLNRRLSDSSRLEIIFLDCSRSGLDKPDPHSSLSVSLQATAGSWGTFTGESGLSGIFDYMRVNTGAPVGLPNFRHLHYEKIPSTPTEDELGPEETERLKEVQKEYEFFMVSVLVAILTSDKTSSKRAPYRPKSKR